MLRGAIDAQGQVGLMLNVEKAHLPAVLSVLPALNSPTISELSDANWVAVNTILEESTVREVIPKLKAAKSHRNRRIPAEQGGPVRVAAHLRARCAEAIAALADRRNASYERVLPQARRIVESVRRGGDAALLRFAHQT